MTYMFAFYLVVKGVEILQIALASSRESRSGIIALGVLTLIGCSFAAIAFVNLQERHASSIGSTMGALPGLDRFRPADTGIAFDSDAAAAAMDAHQAASEAQAAADEAGGMTADPPVDAAQAAADEAMAAAEAAMDAAEAARAAGQ